MREVQWWQYPVWITAYFALMLGLLMGARALVPVIGEVFDCDGDVRCEFMRECGRRLSGYPDPGLCDQEWEDSFR